MKRLFFTTSFILIATFSFSQSKLSAQDKKVNAAALESYVNGFNSASLDLAYALMKFEKVDLGMMDSTAALSIYNFKLSNIFGKAATIADARKAIREKGMLYCEGIALQWMADEMKNARKILTEY